MNEQIIICRWLFAGHMLGCNEPNDNTDYSSRDSRDLFFCDTEDAAELFLRDVITF